MAPLAQRGVVDSAFRVHGLAGLRVVDASVFPRIPGYFPVAAIAMLAEKAADAILADVLTIPADGVSPADGTVATTRALLAVSDGQREDADAYAA